MHARKRTEMTEGREAKRRAEALGVQQHARACIDHQKALEHQMLSVGAQHFLRFIIRTFPQKAPTKTNCLYTLTRLRSNLASARRVQVSCVACPVCMRMLALGAYE